MRSLGPLAELALVVAVLAVGRPVLAPIALAIYIAFVMTPPSDGLERIGIPRGVTVTVMVAAALALFVFVGAVVASQVVDLASQVHNYAAQMTAKLALLRGGHGGTLDTLTDALKQLGRVFESSMPKAEKGEPVHIVGGNENAIERLRSVLGPLLEPLFAFGVVVVLTVFVLAQREDLRGRLIQLVGPQNVTVTTRTLDEAVRRISHLLLGLTYINASFGMLVATGLYIIGIPYAILWGALAAVLRFVPFVGSGLALAMPTFVAFATTPGWGPTLETVGLYAVMDLMSANIIEPLFLGKRTGVSSLALLVSVIFWTWVWGPLGLVLATPLTICIAVMGRHVPQLAFLTVLLGDDPGLPPELNFYQRLLARDGFDAMRIARRSVAATSIIAAFDRLLVPAMRFIARDLDGQAITQETANQVLTSLAEIARRIRPGVKRGPPDALPKPTVVGVAADSNADGLLIDLLTQATASDVSIEPIPLKTRDEVVRTVIARAPRLVCISALPPGSNVTARFVCRRIRKDLPDCRIIVLLPSGEHDRSAEAAARLRESGANGVAFDLATCRDLLLAETALKESIQ